MSDIFAGKDNPIRCSKLAAISKCSARIFLMGILDNEDGEGGAPAQTGSLVHVGVAEFHKVQGDLKKRQDAAWRAIANAASLFPLAEQNEVRLFLTPYISDPRNINAEMLAVEQPIEFTLPPHEIDPTGELIYVEGTLDQVRIVNGIPLIEDLKTGKKTGWEMVHDYATQVAAYTYGVRKCLDIPNAQPGRIIRNYGYRVRGATELTKSPDGVFFQVPFKWDGVETLLETVRFGVALMRMGYFHFNPGPHCTYCEFGGLTGCIPQLEQLGYKK